MPFINNDVISKHQVGWRGREKVMEGFLCVLTYLVVSVVAVASTIEDPEWRKWMQVSEYNGFSKKTHHNQTY